jgi:tetratricopeptide (TPR) repeat protein
LLLSRLAGDAAAQRSDAEEKAAAHYKQGRAFYDAGVYDKALVEFDAAYALAPRSLIFYHKARAYQGLGDKAKALELYQRFVEEDPDNKASYDARAQIVALTKDLATATPLPPAEPPPGEPPPSEPPPGEPPPSEPPPGEPPPVIASNPDAAAKALPPPEQPLLHEREASVEHAGSNRRMIWLAAGAAAIAAGVALDTLPESAGNGTLDGLDFAPIGLYGLGVTGLVLAAF